MGLSLPTYFHHDQSSQPTSPDRLLYSRPYVVAAHLSLGGLHASHRDFAYSFWQRPDSRSSGGALQNAFHSLPARFYIGASERNLFR